MLVNHFFLRGPETRMLATAAGDILGEYQEGLGARIAALKVKRPDEAALPGRAWDELLPTRAPVSNARTQFC
jgi:hypothetical protein